MEFNYYPEELTKLNYINTEKNKEIQIVNLILLLLMLIKTYLQV